MDTPANDDSTTLESIAREQQLLVDAVNALSSGVTSLSNAVTALSTGQNSLSNGLRAVSEGEVALADSMRTLAGEQQRLGKALMGMNDKLDGIRDDIGLVRGGHARNEVLRNAPLISDALGYQVVTELPRTALISLGKAAAADGKSRGEVESFRNADAVLLGQAEDGRQGYIAVEVSFTVDANDVRRAVRNAQYLEAYTGFPSCAIVAGVDILQEAQEQVDGGKAYFYRIPKRDLQAQ